MTTIRLYESSDYTKYTECSDVIQLELRRTGGNPCDSFSVTLPHTAALYDAAVAAARVRVLYNDAVMFTGVVDECRVELGADGTHFTIDGRGLAALMMECECTAAEYVRATLNDIVPRLVMPCGISEVDAEGVEPVSDFDIAAGTTHWRALMNFCGWSAFVVPRFDRLGRLVIKHHTISGGTVAVSGDKGVALLEARVGEKRRGLYSSATVTERITRRTTGYSDPAMTAAGIGGSAHMVAPNGRLSSYQKRARWLVEQSKRDWRTAEVRMGGAFAAEPCDSMDLSHYGLPSGVYIVDEVVSTISRRGAFSHITAWRDAD